MKLLVTKKNIAEFVEVQTIEQAAKIHEEYLNNVTMNNEDVTCNFGELYDARNRIVGYFTFDSEFIAL